MFGFVAKEDAFAGLEPGSFAYAGLVLTPVVLASVLTVAYSLRFAWGALGFAGVRRTRRVAGEARRRRRVWFVAPAGVLAALTVLFGLVPAGRRRPDQRRGASRCRRRSSRCTSRSGTAWDLPLVLSVRRARRRPRPVPRPPTRRPGAGARPPRAERRRGVPRGPAGPQHAVRPGHRRGAERLAAGVRGRDPDDGGAAHDGCAGAGRRLARVAGGLRVGGSRGGVRRPAGDGAGGRRRSTAGSRPRCCSAPPATPWRACSSCRAGPTWR